MHQPAKWRFYVLVCIFAALLVYLRREHHQSYITTDSNEFVIDANRKMTRSQIKEMAEKYGKPKIVEKSVCLNNEMCFDIRDRFIHDDNMFQFRRQIIAGKMEMSSMLLKHPERLNAKKMDTFNWKVDKGAHNFNRYTLTMIEEMFLSGTVRMDEEANVRVLCLGLGGGYVNSYLHHHFPKMDITVVELYPKMVEIAKKWFDLSLDRRHHLVMGDAWQFIDTSVEKGEMYDIVLLDVCSLEDVCPAGKAIKKETAKKFSLLLNGKGALIANVFSMSNEPLQHGLQLKTSYGSAFKYCSLRKSPNSNLIMTCTNHPRPKSLEEKYGVFMKYPTSPDRKLPNVELV
ncbi:hypothetical protein RB195_009521 [Necator americanus]|uniref:Uncharacterized protein n=1 Tax=Necator americanus TaxID=51031 RepID=A0ABR1CUF9_NECAM